MIVITDDWLNSDNYIKLSNGHNAFFGYVENDKILHNYFEQFYSIPSQMIDIFKEYPNLIISALLESESDFLNTNLISYQVYSILELREKLDYYKDSYVVLHSIITDKEYFEHTNKHTTISLQLFVLNQTINNKFNNFLRTHTINSLLKTL